MARFDDSITIAASTQEVRGLLHDLQRHPSYVPDGFKEYRLLSRETAGEGARAAASLNLLGHWLPAELEVAGSTPQRVVIKASLEPVHIELGFDLVDRGGRSEVRMSVDFNRKTLPPWRIRTRIKQRLRLEQDIRGLVNRFLSVLKKAAEASPMVDDRVAGTSAGKPAAASHAGPTAPDHGAKKAAAGARPAKAAPKAAPSGSSPAPGSSPASSENGHAKPAAGAPAQSASSASAGEFVPAGLEAEIGPGQARVVKVGGRDVAIFNVDGELHAIDNTCAHRGGPLGFGVLDGSIVTCPLHGFRFDVTTGICPEREQLRVARYELRRQNGEIQVRSTPVPA